jgi:glycoprotein endo-alpha-1,2-mannosidase
MKTLLPTLVVLASVGWAQAQIAAGILTNKHSASSRFSSYEGRVMCGYQGWFRAEGDGAGRGWVHYCTRGRFEPASLKVDLWPEVSEYEKTYPTPFLNRDGTPARVFSS